MAPWTACTGPHWPEAPPHDRGSILIALLLTLVLLGATQALLGTVWATAAQREKEAELLFVGDQYREAIESFYERSPGEVKRYPRSFQELLQDPRFPHTVRHLRRIWRDPMTGSSEWGLVPSPDGGIMGVYSLSEKRPLKTAGFPRAYESFAGAGSYRDWQFVHRPGDAAGAAQIPDPPAGRDTRPQQGQAPAP